VHINAWKIALKNGSEMLTHMCVAWLENTYESIINNKWVALHHFHVYLAEVADLVLQKRRQNRIQTANQNSDSPSLEDFSDELVKGPLKIHHITSTPEDMESRPYTPVFAQRVLDWFQELEWPDENMAGHDSRPCPLLELYTDFALSTQTLAPAQLIPKAICVICI